MKPQYQVQIIPSFELEIISAQVLVAIRTPLFKQNSYETKIFILIWHFAYLL